MLQKNYFLLTLLLIVMSATNGNTQTTYIINDPESLEDQVYMPGDEIILENGIYDTDGRITFVGNGTSDSPIVFRAETPGGVRFTGGLRMDIGGDYVVVDGFHWQGGYGASNFIQFRDGYDYANHSKIQNCVIDGLTIDPDDIADDMANNSITKHRWIVLYGTFNSVLNCSFMNKESAGALILAEYEYNAEEDRCATVGHRISNNYFYKYAKIDPTLSNAGDSETIRIGTSEYQNVNSDVVVSNNYFVEADGENEIITNKSKGNTYLNNTFRRCRGSLVLRHGSQATVTGNYFLGENVDGTGGIRITDSNHEISHNYIQDCITVQSQAKWNNGITFLGGGDNNDVICSSTSVSNGYQKSLEINVSNNSIINTNAPLFYNTDKGSTDPTGVVSNNLIYFQVDHPNVSHLISGDTDSSYEDLGQSLDYVGNVYVGTDLGEQNDGFTLDSGITAIPDGEIWTFTGADGKGADMGANRPLTDAMVGYGIGACFTDYLGEPVIDGDCIIEEGEQLIVSNLPILSAGSGSYEVSVNSNVNWAAVANDDWITISPSEGQGNGMITLTVEENTESTNRVGSVTFTQKPGGSDLMRTLSITQEGLDLTELLDLINVGTGQETDLVTVHSFSKEEVNGDDKFNYASNTLDKDPETVWAADDGPILSGDFKGDGEYIIYDLGGDHRLDMIQFTTTNKDEAFGYQVFVSTTGTEEDDFEMILPETGDLLLTAVNSTEFNQYAVSIPAARYVKLLGFGRFNEAGDTRTSVWSAVGEIEFYGEALFSNVKDTYQENVLISPIPTKENLSISQIEGIEEILLSHLDGRVVLKQRVGRNIKEINLDVSTLPSGTYLISMIGSNGITSRLVVIE